ncbi:hypothetical protein [Photobacterium leiognathi]|uniref:hypothetical protein n=1 Tax=Photobacterium leiognathi TaxID=553611 RepID=UPI002738D698|nr:hypothetical protein [Photobacterium leiognathi]
MNDLTVLEKLHAGLKDSGYRAIRTRNSRKRLSKDLIIKGEYICFKYNSSAEIVIQERNGKLDVTINPDFNNIQQITLDSKSSIDQLIESIDLNVCVTDESDPVSGSKPLTLKESITATTKVIDLINHERLTTAFDGSVLSSFKALKKAYHSKLKMEIDNAEWIVAYLYLCDLESGVTASVNFNRVCAYFGIEPDQLENDPVPSPSVMIKAFGGKSIAVLSDAVDVPVNSLRNWFTTKPIIFHALLMFAISR